MKLSLPGLAMLATLAVLIALALGYALYPACGCKSSEQLRREQNHAP